MSVSQTQILKPIKLKNIEHLEVMNAMERVYSKVHNKNIEENEDKEDPEDQRQ